MITLDYRLSQIPSPKEASVDIANPAVDDFTYALFPGDIVFKVDDCDFSALWDWIPIVDFAAALRHIVHELKQTTDGQSVFEFTESEATIDFVRDEDVVTISASYVSCQAQVQLNELRTASDDFSNRVMAGILQKQPGLKGNSILQQLLTQP